MKAMRAMLRGVGPSAVLRLLADGEKTGYELAQALAQGGSDVLPFGEGAAYALLHELRARRLITARLDKTGSIAEQVYSLRDKGRQRLEREQQRAGALAQIAGAMS